MIIVLKDMIVNMDNVDLIDIATDNFGDHARIFFKGDRSPNCKLDMSTYRELVEKINSWK
jgi:hypothetical protein